VKAGSAVHTIAIEERQRRITELRGAIHEGFGQ
jgi:hypothetical protein